jgi:hypothetical protein
MIMRLAEIASIIRSKNASPFILTIDIFFDNKENYEKVKNSGVLTKRRIADLYKIPEDYVLGIYYVDLVMGIKISILKPVLSDEIDYSDVYGCQQHVPLLDLEIP